MNLLYSLNYIVFAAFFTLFAMEVGIALTLLIKYDENKDRLKRYLMPIWEVTGTFGIFYVVNFEASFPLALGIIGGAYLAPLLVAAMFFIGRNAFVAYSEYAGEPVREKTYLRIYSVMTVATAFIAIAVLSSGISGIGINLQSGALNIFAMLFNPFDILVFVAIALLALFVSEVYFQVGSLKRVGLVAAPMGIILVAVAVYAYIPAAITGMSLGDLVLLALVVALFLVIAFLDARKSRIARRLAPVWAFVAINLFGAVLYPRWFGGAASALSYLVNAASGYYAVVVTLVGGALLAAAMSFFIYITYIKKTGGY